MYIVHSAFTLSMLKILKLFPSKKYPESSKRSKSPNSNSSALNVLLVQSAGEHRNGTAWRWEMFGRFHLPETVANEYS